MRQRKLTAPAVRFLEQAIQPLESEAPPRRRRAFHLAADNVERAADPNAGAAAGLAHIVGQPELLFGKSHPGEQKLRAAVTDLLRDSCGFFRCKESVARPGDAKRGIALLQYARSLFRYARRTAEQEHANAVARRSIAQVLDEFDAGYAVLQLRSARTDDCKQSDGVAQRQRARIHHGAVARISLRVHDHFRTQRHDLRAASFTRELDDAIGCLVRIDGVETTPQYLHYDSAFSRNGSRSGNNRCASISGIASRGKRHSPALKPN